MNQWLQLSMDYAQQRTYLDDLFRVYPTIPDGIRSIDQPHWNSVEVAYHGNDNTVLLKQLLSLPLFPIKDSYVAYLRRDPTAIDRNPATANRLAGRIRELGLAELHRLCSQPKETNRQLGPVFSRWLSSGALGVRPLPLAAFLSTDENAVLSGSDAELQHFARSSLNYRRDKGLDFIGRFNGKYVLGEAKFLTDYGGHQHAQFLDAIATLESKDVSAVAIAVLDGVLYIPSKQKMHQSLLGAHASKNIMSSLVLREFLYSL